MVYDYLKGLGRIELLRRFVMSENPLVLVLQDNKQENSTIDTTKIQENTINSFL